jgi:hypothetical protein
MDMQITVQLKPSVAKALHAGRETAASAGISALVREAGGKLAPMHPGTDDKELQRFFIVEAPESRIPALLKQLQQHAAVQAAYQKPPEGLP